MRLTRTHATRSLGEVIGRIDVLGYFVHRLTRSRVARVGEDRAADLREWVSGYE